MLYFLTVSNHSAAVICLHSSEFVYTRVSLLVTEQVCQCNEKPDVILSTCDNLMPPSLHKINFWHLSATKLFCLDDATLKSSILSGRSGDEPNIVI